VSERHFPDHSMDVQRRLREQQEAEKRIRKGIWIAQNAPESIERLLSFATAVIPDEGDRRAIAIMLPSGKQLHLVMRPQIYRSLAGELLAEDDVTSSSIEIPGDG
jgi:hypothetical protein